MGNKRGEIIGVAVGNTLNRCVCVACQVLFYSYLCVGRYGIYHYIEGNADQTGPIDGPVISAFSTTRASSLFVSTPPPPPPPSSSTMPGGLEASADGASSSHASPFVCAVLSQSLTSTFDGADGLTRNTSLPGFFCTAITSSAKDPPPQIKPSLDRLDRCRGHTAGILFRIPTCTPSWPSLVCKVVNG